ncbi:hypothetical protein EC988_001195 [Linderina pennispora]|nr:hypothetical protein EC988_001195 [Linderina pennispora]
MHHPTLDSGMRFECILEAPTAAAQKVDEPALTYLNKGQLYGISLQDRTHSEEYFSTTLRITFHEDSHRKGASTYWNFWLNQQENPRTARAVELDKAGSIGVIAAESRLFDRVTFQWQGRRGAKVMIRFNCLSTDFSRIKGVKGIPLRIHLDTCQAVPTHTPRMSINPSVADFTASISQLSSPITSMPPTSAAHVASVPQATRSLPGLSGADDLNTAANSGTTGLEPPGSTTTATFPGVPIPSSSGLTAGKVIERCYARVKLFRDKGAERKNKDDQRHMDKMWEKHKAKHALNNSTQSHQQQYAEFNMTFAPVQPVTGFIEYTMTGDDCDPDEPAAVDELWAAGASASATGDSPNGMSQLAGLTSIGIGVPGMTLSGLNSPIATTFPRKRSAENSEALSPNKRQFSPTSLSSGINASFASGAVELVGVDPTYVPMPRKNKAVLAIYVKVMGQAVYRAVYLDRLAVDDLVSKLTQKLEIQANSDIEVIRRTKKGLTVRVDDNVISQLEDEQDMEIECSFAPDTGALTIYLNY